MHHGMALYSPLKSVDGSEKEGGPSSIDNGSDISEEELLLGYARARWTREAPITWNSWIKRHRLAVFIHTLLVSANLLLGLFFIGSQTSNSHGEFERTTTLNSLDRLIEPEERHFELRPIYKHGDNLNPDKPNNLNGPPRPELEAEWNELMKYSEVRVNKEDLGQFSEDDSIVELGDESGYFVTVSAFHGLHCVRRIRQYMYPEVYYTNLTDHERLFLRMHTEHCLDWLRQYVQCHADPTLIPIHWMTDVSTPVSKDRGLHQCVSWDPIMQWMKDHTFDSTAPDILVHPVYGVPGIINSTGPAIGLSGAKGGLLHADGHYDDGLPHEH